MRLRVLRVGVVLEYLLAIVLLLCCSSVYYYAGHMRYFDAACLVVSSAYFAFKVTRRNIRINLRENGFDKILLVYVFLLALVWITIQNKTAGFYLRFFILFPMYLLIVFMSTRTQIISLIGRVSNAIFVLTAASVFLWIAGPVLRLLPPTGSVNIVWGNPTQYDSYFGLLFSTTIQSKRIIGNILLLRNLSIFPEGPFSALVFVLGFAYEALVNPAKPRTKRMVIYFVAILATISTSGIIMAVIIVGIRRFFLKKRVSRSEKIQFAYGKMIAPILITVIMCIAVLYLLEFKRSTDSGNFSAHFGDFLGGLRLFLAKPFTGWGYNSSGTLIGYNNTSGLFKVLTYGGLPFGALYLFPFIKGMLSSVKMKNWNNAAFILIVFLMFLLVIWQNSYLIFLYMSAICTNGFCRLPGYRDEIER